MIHSASTKNHRLESWVYSDQTARLAATGFTSGDVSHIAYVTADKTYWRLDSIGPIVWAPITPVVNGIPAGGTAAQLLAKVDGTDYNVHWIPAPSGGGGPTVVTDSHFNAAGAGADTIDVASIPTTAGRLLRIMADIRTYDVDFTDVAADLRFFINGDYVDANYMRSTIDGVTLTTGNDAKIARTNGVRPLRLEIIVPLCNNALLIGLAAQPVAHSRALIVDQSVPTAVQYHGSVAHLGDSGDPVTSFRIKSSTPHIEGWVRVTVE